jgi:hypothetical protein
MPTLARTRTPDSVSKERRRGGEAVVLGVDGIADFNALHSVKSMRRHRRGRRNTVDLSEWFASVYSAS